MKKFIFLLLIVTNTINAQVPSYVPTNGLVGYWPFNGNANDESGNGNNGVVNGATLTADRNGNSNSAYSFDGINNYIHILDAPSLRLQNGTINCWVRYNSMDKMALLMKQNINDASDGNYGFEINDYAQILGPGPRIIGVYGGCSFQNSIATHTPGIDLSGMLWHQLTAVYDVGIMKIYIDGALVGSEITILPSMNACAGSDLLLGRGWQGFPLWYSGELDDLSIYNRVLTQTEITNIFNSANTNECLTMVINTGALSTNPVTYTSSVSIYPNPANDQITIDCGNLANVVGWNIKITNMLGQEVFNQPMNTQQYVVPLNTWTGQGMYFVKILNAQNEVVNIKKIILQ